MTRITRISYVFIFATILIAGLSGLAAPFVTVLFSYLALSTFQLSSHKFFPIFVFIILVVAAFFGFVAFVRNAIDTLPKVADKSIPIIVEYGQRKGLDLPFDDVHSLKTVVIETVKNELGELANFAKIATKDFISVIIAFVVAISIFLNGKLDLDEGKHKVPYNVYSIMCTEFSARFTAFYYSFATVMGAQLIISAINTTFTGIFLWFQGIPHAAVITVLTFLCGLLPIVGNLISNSIIVGVTVTESPKLAISALIFLVVLHKLEYFLNSKIIGNRIKNPMWLTLLGLVVGEKFMGIPGMILAPVLLHYIKSEFSQIEYSERNPSEQDRLLVASS